MGWAWIKPKQFKNSDFVEVKLQKFGRFDGYAGYTKDGRIYRLQRVTTINKLYGSSDGLVNWAANQAALYFLQQLTPNRAYSQAEIERLYQAARGEWRNVRDEAAKYGTLTHQWIEAFLQNGQWPNDEEWATLPSEVQNSLLAFCEFWDAHGFKVVHVEKYLLNAWMGYGGTADLIAMDKDGKIWLIDWKTSKGLYEDMARQVSAYFGACHLMGINVSRCMIVRFGKYDGSVQMCELELDEIKTCYRIFERLCYFHGFTMDQQRKFKKLTDKHNQEVRLRAEAEAEAMARAAAEKSAPAQETAKMETQAGAETAKMEVTSSAGIRDSVTLRKAIKGKNVKLWGVFSDVTNMDFDDNQGALFCTFGKDAGKWHIDTANSVGPAIIQELTGLKLVVRAPHLETKS